MRFIRFLILIYLVGACKAKQNSEVNNSENEEIRFTPPVIYRELDLKKYYEAENLDGYFSYFDPAKHETRSFKTTDTTLHDKPVTPASTYNILTALIALEEGILKDSNSMIHFDGIHRSKSEDANKDIPLKIGFRRNIDWVFLNLRKKIGVEKTNNWISRIHYGNEAKSTDVDTILNSGGKSDTFLVVPPYIKVTPEQQLQFVYDLRNDSLPFSKAHMQTVRDMMYLTEINGYKVYGKQGSYLLRTEGRYIGWLVGWFEKGGAVCYYVNFVQTPDLSHPTIVKVQREIVYAILRDDALR